MTIYNLTNDHLYLLSLLEDPESDPDVIRDTLEASLGNIEAEAENLIVVTKEIESDIDKFDKEIERLTKQKKYMENSVSRVKNAVMDAMQAIGLPKLKTEHFKLSVAKNGGLRPLKITGEVSDSFMILEPKPDMKRIREALEEGFELNFAHLEERGSHLNIK